MIGGKLRIPECFFATLKSVRVLYSALSASVQDTIGYRTSLDSAKSTPPDTSVVKKGYSRLSD